MTQTATPEDVARSRRCLSLCEKLLVGWYADNDWAMNESEYAECAEALSWIRTQIAKLPPAKVVSINDLRGKTL